MADRAFRFGVIGAPSGTGEQWRALAVQAASLGYQTFLMPDVPHLLAPGPSLAVAATAADIRVGTWVYSTPTRPPLATAWEAHSLSVLTGGRFEMGIGTGHPQLAAQFASRLGLPFGSPTERLSQLAATITALRSLDGEDLHTPVLVAALGTKARSLAAEQADTVAIAAGPLTPREEVARLAADVRARAAGRDIEFAMNLIAVGERIPPYVKQATGVDAADLISADSLVLLRGNTQAMADELRRRRDQIGASYILVNADVMSHFAPVLELLA